MDRNAVGVVCHWGGCNGCSSPRPQLLDVVWCSAVVVVVVVVVIVVVVRSCSSGSCSCSCSVVEQL